MQHPGVLECAAVGVPDKNAGEAVKLFVVKKDPNLTEEMIQEFCKEQLTGYKKPKYIVFRDDLPKSNVLQFELADGTKISARPSGTEPKIKFYFSVNEPLMSAAKFHETEMRLDARIENIIAEMKLK